MLLPTSSPIFRNKQMSMQHWSWKNWTQIMSDTSWCVILNFLYFIILFIFLLLALTLYLVIKQVQNLETLLLQAPNQSVRVGDSRILSQLLSQKLKPTQENNPLRRWYQKTKYFIMDNWQRLWVMMLWLGIVASLFTYKFVQYRHKAAYEVMGYCVCTAKGAAETLKFNMALILLPVCRNTITWLRNKTKLGIVVPFDDNLNFHKVPTILCD